VLIALFMVTIVVDYDNTPLATLFAPAIPIQIYQPTLPAADQKVVCIVFDDGWKNQLEALPILQSYGYKATFAIVTGYTSYPQYMTWKEIRHIANMGMEIASHTHTHLDLGKANAQTIYDELSKSQAILRSRGYAANILVYPYGDSGKNQTVQEAVAQFYLLGRGTVEGKCNVASCNRYNLEAYDVYHDVDMADFKAYLEGTGGTNVTILYYHKIADGDEETAVSKETFRVQMQYLADNGYSVWTLGELFLKPAPAP
jgi:peptidoglycan/xylan/chitin deacetylase (PgdA/CDA1 family)